MTGTETRKYFELIRQNETKWDLFDLAVEICRIIEPDLDSKPYQNFIGEMVLESLDRVEANSDAYTQVEALNTVIFGHYGFTGNEDDYYNPSNSYMTRVLEQRKGIPITLSILYREIASRIGLKLSCVALPGHFLLKFRMSGQEIFIDAFAQGKMILPDECRELVQRIYRNQIDFKPSFLQKSNNRTCLLRLLVNLKQVYRTQGDNLKLLEVIEHRIPLLMDPSREILERGLIFLSLKKYSRAILDIESFLAKNKDQKIKEALTSRLHQIRRLAEED